MRGQDMIKELYQTSLQGVESHLGRLSNFCMSVAFDFQIDEGPSVGYDVKSR